MPEIAFEAPLDETAREWIRYRFITIGGHVITFMVQYETTVDGERAPVVRYDNAHGYAHRDILNQRGEVIEKTPLPGNPPPGVALNLGKRDIEENWQRYRWAFLGDAR